MVNKDGYDGVHSRYDFGERNEDGERLLEFCDMMELTVAQSHTYLPSPMCGANGHSITLCNSHLSVAVFTVTLQR